LDLQENKNIKIFNIWHNKLFDHCYDQLNECSLNSVIMYDVNPKYNKVYNKDKKFNILREYELDIYDKTLQETNYCQTSCMYHVFINNLYKDLDYIGFIQYDMVLDKDFINDIQDKVKNNSNHVYFYSLLVGNKIDVKYICNPYENSILEKYNTYFNTSHSYESIKNNIHSKDFICLHTFVIPIHTYIKMMKWYCSIHDDVHKNYLNNIYQESISEITEEILGLFLLLQMIEDETIILEELKLNHEWPALHNLTEWDNYKIQMPVNVLQKENTKPTQLCFDIGANIGNWALSNINKYTKIISVEASPSTYEQLKNTIKNHSNIIPLNYAVCDSNHEYITFYEAESNVLSSLNKEWISGDSSRFNVNYKNISTKTISLDRLIEMYGIPDLIKIDVESAEYSCIKSLTKKVNHLCFEWASENLIMILNSINYLYKLGFRNFFVQLNSDEYTFTPTTYYSIQDVKNILNNTTPKVEWGMIWCK
jgi:FkbM family methyltransferase